MLTDAQVERYSRQIILPPVGGRGQLRLLSASVAVVGAGATGSAVALYLAAAGVGAVEVLDTAPLTESDLDGGLLHTPAALGRNRAASVVEALAALNPDCRATARPAPEHAAEAAAAAAHAAVIDAGGRWTTSLLLNAACIRRHTPLVWGRATGFTGEVGAYVGAQGPCLQCLNRADAPAAPPWGLTAGLIGTVLAAEAVKVLLGMGTSLHGRLRTLDVLHMTAREVAVAANPRCAACALGVHAPAEGAGA